MTFKIIIYLLTLQEKQVHKDKVKGNTYKANKYFKKQLFVKV